MTDELDTTQNPATPEPGADTGTAPSAPAGPPADILQDAPSVGETDLELESGEGDAGDTDAPGDDSERPSWRRPEGLEGDDLAAWKEERGLPVDASGYQIDLGLQEGQQVTEAGQQLLDGLKDFALERDMPAETVNGLANWYNEQTAAHQARLVEGDQRATKEAREVLSEQWGGEAKLKENLSAIRSFLDDEKRVPPDAAAAIKSARSADGQRLINNPAIASMLLQLARGQTAQPGKQPTTQSAKGRSAMTEDLKAELAEIDAAMHEDVRSLYKPWKTTGMTASDRKLQIGRQLDAAASAQDHNTSVRSAASDEERE